MGGYDRNAWVVIAEIRTHGTGWLPTGNNTTRSFGDDNGESIDIYDLADSIGGKFDYIIFDACYMGGVEVATEFQSKCRYFLASPSTVPTIGIIDATSIRFLIKDCSLPERLTNLCKYFHETKDVPISLIDLGKFDNFINAVNLLQINFDSLSFSDIATYSFRTNYIFFDLYSLFYKINEPNILLLLNQIILYPQNIEDNCYVSIYIPTEENEAYWNNYSKTLWNINLSFANIYTIK